MKKIPTILLTTLVFLACMQIAAAVTEAPEIKVTMISQEPDPVAPGNIVTAHFRIENIGYSALEDVKIKLVLSDPIDLYGNEKAEKDIGTISASQFDNLGVRTDFRLIVDKNAATGPNKIEFWYQIKNQPWAKYADFEINVRQREALIAINHIATDSEITPGSTTKVSFRVENLADSTIRNLKLNLDFLTPLVTASSVTYRELPFTPIGSGNQKTVKILEPGKFEDVNFNLFTDANAESKIYKVPYSLSYSDDYGTNFTSSGILGLLVSSKPELDASIDANTLYAPGVPGKITIKIVNKGFGGVKFVNVKLANSDNIQVISSPTVYIGKLDSDDYESADFSILLNTNANKEINLPLTIEFRDANGKPFASSPSLKLSFNPGARPRSNAGTVFLVLILLIAIGAAIFFYIRRRRKRMHRS